MRRSTGVMLFIFMLCLLSIPEILEASTLQISWNRNTESDLSGYKVYYGASSRNYPHVLNVGNAATVTINGFEQGSTYYIAITAYDYSGNESGYSEEVSISIPVTGQQETMISRIVRWLSTLFGGGQAGDAELSQYTLQDFSSITESTIQPALTVVQGGSGQVVHEQIITDLDGKAVYVVRDIIAEVGETFDLTTVYPDGMHLFLPLTEDAPEVENDCVVSWAPGAYLYMVSDDTGELIHILRLSVLDMLNVAGEYQNGSYMYLQDEANGISITFSSQAIEGSAPIGIGHDYSTLMTGSAQSWNTSIIEFAIAPYGLILSEPAEVCVAFDGTAAAAEYYDEGEKQWKQIPAVRVEDGVAVFSVQALGRFKVYEAPDSGSPEGSGSGGGGGGGGCFISTCIL